MPTAVAILAFILGVCTGVIAVACVLIVRGGGSLRDDDRRRADRVSLTRRDW